MLGPIDIDERNWCYTEDNGLLFVHEAYMRNGVFIQTDQFVVPWRVLRLALAIHDKTRRPRKPAVAKDGRAPGARKKPVGRSAGKQKRTPGRRLHGDVE